MKDEERFFREVDIAADRVCGSLTMLDDLKLAHREAAVCHCPDLTEEGWRRLFERWFLHYKDLLMAREEAADTRAMKLWDERRSLLLQRTFLPAGPQRQAAENRLQQIAREIADLYRTGRPPAPAAVWVSE